MKADLFLRNALVVTETNIIEGGGVVVADGRVIRITEAGENVAAGRVVDLMEKVILPGLVDGHAHFNEPGREEWEGYCSGTMAAAAGGITTIVDMPLNATPPTINSVELARKREAVTDQAVVDYAHWGGLVDNNIDELSAMWADGVVGFKAFMSESGVDFARVDDDVLFAAFHALPSGAMVSVHAENEHVTQFLAAQLQEQGRTDRSAWTESRPPFAEEEAIRRAIFWAEQTNGTLHIVHASTTAALDAVAHARKRGVNISVETCPHYPD